MNLAVFFRYHAEAPTFFGFWDVPSNDEIYDVKILIWNLYNRLIEHGATLVFDKFEDSMLEEGYAMIASSAVIATNCLVLELGEEDIWAEEKRHDEEERARLARRTPEDVKRDEEHWRALLQEADELFEEEDRELGDEAQ